MKKVTCIICPKGCQITVEKYDNGYLIEGYGCKRGKEYALQEITNPKRILTTTVKTCFDKMPRLPVKTDNPVPKKLIFEIMKETDKIEVTEPVHIRDIIINNILNTGSNIIATSNLF